MKGAIFGVESSDFRNVRGRVEGKGKSRECGAKSTQGVDGTIVRTAEVKS